MYKVKLYIVLCENCANCNTAFVMVMIKQSVYKNIKQNNSYDIFLSHLILRFFSNSVK